MKSTQTIAGQQPWRVGVSVVAEQAHVPEYIQGKPIPHTRIAQGYMLVHGFDIQSARQRAERIVRAVYEDNILRVHFFNTEPASPHERHYDSLPGLTLRV